MDIIENNSLSIAQRMNVSDINELEIFPKFFEIETIRACNARCSFCSIKDWRNMGRVVMSDELFDKFCGEISEFSGWINTVCLNRDGEPTLDKKIVERVRRVKEIGIKKVTLSTNAELLNEKLAGELIGAGLDDIMISLDGFTKEVYESIRTGLDFETVVNNTINLFKLRDAVKSPMSIRVRMVIIDSNKHEVDDWMKFWTKYAGAADRVYAMPAHNWGNQVNIGAAGGSRPNGSACIFPFSSMAVHVNGEVGLCNADYNATVNMGDISRKSIRDVWNGDEYRKIRKIHLEGGKDGLKLCNGCAIWDRTYLEGAHPQN